MWRYVNQATVFDLQLCERILYKQHSLMWLRTTWLRLNSSSTTSAAIVASILYHSGNADFDIFHNSVSVANGSATSGRALVFEQVYVSHLTSLLLATWFKNNIFTNTGGGYAAEASSSAVAGTYFTADYNVYNATGTSPFKYNNSAASDT